MHALKCLRAFLLGLWEFRSDFTTNVGHDLDVVDAYDRGRNLAHRVTFNRFQECGTWPE